jgi:hypothetical protein
MADEYVPAFEAKRAPSMAVSLPRLRISAQARERLLYAGAAVSFVAIGVFVTEFALSWVAGFSWLLLWVWGLPALWRRLRR